MKHYGCDNCAAVFAIEVAVSTNDVEVTRCPLCGHESLDELLAVEPYPIPCPLCDHGSTKPVTQRIARECLRCGSLFSLDR